MTQTVGKGNTREGLAITITLLFICSLLCLILGLFIGQHYLLAAVLTGIGLIVFGLLVFLGYAFEDRFSWIGLGTGSRRRARTLWDWLGLLIVPFILSGATIGLSINQGLIATAQRTNDIAIAEKQNQAATLQNYLDRMSELILNQNIHARNQTGDDVRILARARSLTILQSLDIKGKATVLKFLYYGGLIKLLDPQSQNIDPVVNLDGADLSGVDLSYIKLNAANLQVTNLSNAKLFGTNLSTAYLPRTNLEQAHLDQALLCYTPFVGAPGEVSDLKGAFLNGAHLSGANLAGADLRGADLSNANLGATDSVCQAYAPKGTGLISTNLSGVIWGNTICPDGTNSDRDASHSCKHHLSI